MTKGERIKKILEIKRLNQLALSKLIHIGQSTISQYIKGTKTPSDAVLYRISNELNISYDWLSTGKGEMETKKFQTADEIQDHLIANYGFNEELLIKLNNLANGTNGKNLALKIKALNLLMEYFKTNSSESMNKLFKLLLDFNDK